jgi:hypothetical protein
LTSARRAAKVVSAMPTSPRGKPTQRPTAAAKAKAPSRGAAKRAPAEPSGGVFDALAGIPAPPDLYRIAAALHVLDAIAAPAARSFTLEVRADHRRFRYDHGNGDQLAAYFSADGHLIRGFDHESPMSPYDADELLWPGLYAGLPNAGLLPTFRRAEADEPGIAAGGLVAAATFAAWWERGGGRWRAGRQKFPAFDALSSDGASYLLGCLTPAVRFVEQRGWPAAAVARVMAHEPLSRELVGALRADADLAAARRAADAVGYGRPFPFA